MQASGKGGRGFGHVFFAEFSTSDDDELRIITGGVGHVKFWTLNGRFGITQHRFTNKGVGAGRKLDFVCRFHFFSFFFLLYGNIFVSDRC